MLRFPYTLALLCLQKLLALTVPNAKLWARNSYLTPAFRPLKSDLDLTLLLKTTPTFAQRLRIKSILARAKRVFPALGETNWYVQNELQMLRSLVNPFELERDPQLQILAPYLAAQKSDASKTVWLLRLLESDVQNLFSNPKKRQKKWQLHLSATGLSWPNNKHFSLATLSELILSKENSPSLNLAVLKYLEARNKNLALHIMVQKDWFDFRLVDLFPHRFCFLEADLLKSKLLGGSLSPITLEQLAWEYFGLYTQFRHQGAIAIFEEHTRHVCKLLEALPEPGPRHQILKQRLAELSQIFATQS